MKKFGKTIRGFLLIGLSILLICLLSAKTYPSTNKTQTYVSKTGLPFREARSVSSLQSECSGLLFAQQMEDSIRVQSPDSIKLKDPKMAVFYAIIPGIVVHGSGHFYAGKKRTGFLLLGAEAVGSVLIFTAIGFAFRNPGQHLLETDLLAWTGVFLFVGSWGYDIVMSPLVVKKQNQQLLERRHSNLELEITDENLKLVVKWRF